MHTTIATTQPATIPATLLEAPSRPLVICLSVVTLGDDVIEAEAEAEAVNLNDVIPPDTAGNVTLVDTTVTGVVMVYTGILIVDGTGNTTVVVVMTEDDVVVNDVADDSDTATVVKHADIMLANLLQRTVKHSI